MERGFGGLRRFMCGFSVVNSGPPHIVNQRVLEEDGTTRIENGLSCAAFTNPVTGARRVHGFRAIFAREGRQADSQDFHGELCRGRDDRGL